MLKKFTLAATTAAVIFALPYSSQAHADVGSKVAEKVASMILEEVFGSIFAKEDPAATAQEVQDIVENAFNKEALDNIGIKMDSVFSSISDYNYKLDYADTNSQIIYDLQTRSNEIQSAIEHHMSHANFMALVKTYMAASTVRIAFLSERRRYVKIAGDAAIAAGTETAEELAAKIESENNIIANAALQSLSDVADFFYEDFYETGPSTQGCLYKYPVTPWVTSNGIIGLNTDIANQDRSTVTCRNYPSVRVDTTGMNQYQNGFMGMVVAGVSPSAQTPFNSTDIMEVHKDDLWAFSIKKWANNPGPHAQDYHMIVVKNQDLARHIRNVNSITKYPELIGDIEGQVITWLDIIATTDQSTSLMLQGLKKAVELGIDYELLSNRYKAKHDNTVANFNSWYSGKLSGWGLNWDMRPTRINFNKSTFYPTDAPAWLVAANK